MCHSMQTWKRAMQLQRQSCVAIYAAACCCVEPKKTSEVATVLKEFYGNQLLENPEVVCQLRRILKCPDLEKVLKQRPKLNQGIKDCLKPTLTERFHLGFAMREFPPVKSENAADFSLLKDLWQSFCTIVELDGSTDSNQVQDQVCKTLEDCAKSFKWNMQGVHLSKELGEPPFLKSKVLVEKLGLGRFGRACVGASRLTQYTTR